MSTHPMWHRVLSEMPLIAILRGIEPHEAAEIGEALQTAGFLCLEVPLNSPAALKSIQTLRERFDGRLFVGAGTVLTSDEVFACHAVGAELIVSPNTDVRVIEAARDRSLISIPGFLTPSEAFVALSAGADALKLFPAESASPAALRAMRAVLPKSTPIFPVGGITVSNMNAFLEAGAAGFGIGSALYNPGTTSMSMPGRAKSFINAWNSTRRK